MKNKIVAGVLALFLGGFGGHKFYLGRPWQGLLYLVFCWTFVPAILALFEAIYYFAMDEQRFNEKYNADVETALLKPSSKTHIKCPDCRELVLRDARVCKHCGLRLEPQ